MKLFTFRIKNFFLFDCRKIFFLFDISLECQFCHLLNMNLRKQLCEKGRMLMAILNAN